MRIVHVITRLIIGGAQENTLLSCEGQHDRGHEVTLITGPSTGPEGSLLERAQRHGFRVEVMDEMVRAIRPVKDWQALQGLTRWLVELRPDVVHTHSSKAGILGRRGAQRAKVPVIVHTIHGLAFTASTSPLVNRFYRVLERQAAPLTTKIICVADAMREQSLAAGIGRPEQYSTVYSGMETAPFLTARDARDAVRSRLGLAPQHVAVGTIARLFHLKGHEDVLNVAPELCRRFPEVRFLWVGDGLLRAQFEARIREMGLSDRFILTGLVPPEQIPELAAAMDVLVHPSRREGLARAIVQGQLAGAPAVAYDIDGNREGLIDGKTGILLPPFDQRRLADAVAGLVEDAHRRQSMGLAGREFALGRFDAKVMVDALERIYAEAIRR